jgi:hypothetical protein
MSIICFPPASLSPDPALYLDLIKKLSDIGTDIVSGTSNTLSKSLPLIVATLNRGFIDVVSRSWFVNSNASVADYLLKKSQRQLDLLLHPRLPPLIRSMPLAESLALGFSEESEEEVELRRSLGLYTSQDELQQRADFEMNDPTVLEQQPPKTLLPAPLPSFPTRDASPLRLPESSDSLRKGKEKALEPPEAIPAEGATALEEPDSTPFYSSVIEIPKSRPSQLTTNSSQTGASSSTARPPMYNVPAAPEGDEDEEMPAINLDSDSELE